MKTEINTYRATESIRQAIAREVARMVRVQNEDELLTLRLTMEDAMSAYRQAIRKAAQTAFES